MSFLRKFGAQVVKEFAELPPAGKQRDQLRDEIRNLSPGDVIAYSHVANANKYEHITIHSGDARITCHTASRQNLDFDDRGLGTMSYVTLLHFRNAKVRIPKKLKDVFR